MDGLLEPGDHALIQELRMNRNRRMMGLKPGEQRSPQFGSGIEFADYREYRHGDDLRNIDWPLYLRTRKFYIRLRAEEKEMTLVILLDNSRSMDSPSPSKALTAKRIACVLAGIASREGSRVCICTMDPALSEVGPSFRNQSMLSGLVARIERLPVTEDFSALLAVRAFGARYGRRCVVVLVSDLLYADWNVSLSMLASSECKAHVIHVLSEAEMEPGLMGETSLVDSETGLEFPIHADLGLLERYAEELAEYRKEVEALCGNTGMAYSLISGGGRLERLFHEDLVRGGLVC